MASYHLIEYAFASIEQDGITAPGFKKNATAAPLF
jgi:hypothetical protein